MLSEGTFRHIAEMFIGDIQGYYPYKSGPRLVEFFNNHFNDGDVYAPGFPSRWNYVVNKLQQMFADGKFEIFLNIILSLRYIATECSISQVQAAELSDEVRKEISRCLEVDGYYITGTRDLYRLIKKEEDLSQIGYGGFAVVYEQKSTGKIVKQLKDEYLGDAGLRSRFKREFTITKSLQDLDGIIRVYDFDENNCLYTMEKANKTLEEYIEGDPDKKTRERLILKILSIMEIVHNRNVIHRDLSPNNIFIVEGKLKIADFGLGKDLQALHSHQTMFTQGMGQFQYCAPEQIAKLKDGDKQSDVFALGGIINYIMTKDPDNSTHVFRSVSEKARMRERDFRFADAGQMLAAIKQIIEVNNRGERRQEAINRIKADQFDAFLEEYIYEQNGLEICRGLSDKQYVKAIRKFMNIDEHHAIHIIQLVSDSYREFCDRSYAAYDPIGDFAYLTINHYSYAVNEIAASILNYVAEVVNRFRAQGQIQDLIKSGVEPLIEEILLREQ